MSDNHATLHANCVLLDDIGVLIRGASGSGKSTVSRALLTAARNRNWFARLVSDDRTEITRKHGRLIARPVEIIKGMIEIRGVGITRVPIEEAALVRLVVDLVEKGPRMPFDEDTETEILSVRLPRLVQIRGEDITEHVLDYIAGDVRPASIVHENFKGFS